MEVYFILKSLSPFKWRHPVEATLFSSSYQVEEMSTRVFDSAPVTTEASYIQHHWPSWCQCSPMHKQLFYMKIFPFFTMFWPKHRRSFTLDHTLHWINEILYTVTDCHYVTAKSVGKSRNGFSYKYLELRSQHTSSLKIDSAHQVKRVRDKDKAQHVPGVLNHPKTTHWEVHYKVYWSKLHSGFHAGVGSLYNLSYHHSRNVVSVS